VASPRLTAISVLLAVAAGLPLRPSCGCDCSLHYTRLLPFHLLPPSPASACTLHCSTQSHNTLLLPPPHGSSQLALPASPLLLCPAPSAKLQTTPFDWWLLQQLLLSVPLAFFAREFSSSLRPVLISWHLRSFYSPYGRTMYDDCTLYLSLFYFF
jgi:hypothetical protein